MSNIMFKHFELLNPKIVLLFKSLGIDYMSIIQKPQRITRKIKKTSCSIDYST